MKPDASIDRLCEAVADRRHNRAAARDIVHHLQCFSADGTPLFSADQIHRILQAVGQIAEQAAIEGDDRRLKRMLDAQLKLATVAQQLAEIESAESHADEILARLRDRARAASAN